ETVPGGTAWPTSRQRLPEPGYPNRVVWDARPGHGRATPAHGPPLAIAAPAACAWIDSHDTAHASLPRDDPRRSGDACGPLRTLQSLSQRTTACSINTTENSRAARNSHRGRL